MFPDDDFAALPKRPPFRRPPWPFRTRAWRRVRWLLLAPLLAIMLEGTVRIGVHMVMVEEPNDHAIVWVQGSDGALAATEAGVLAHRALTHGRRAGQLAFDTSAPAGCEGAEAFEFARLHPHELRAAADELRAIAQRAGARGCGGNMFIFNHVPALGAPGALHDNLVHVAWLAGVPMLAVLAWPWGLGERLALPPTWAWAGWRPRSLVLGLAVGLALVAVLWPLRYGLQLFGVAPPGVPAAHALPGGLGSALLMFLLLPFLNEVAYRGWALPLATRTLGPRLALVVPVLLAAAIQGPAPHAWPALVVPHIALGLLVQRSGSLAACIVAHAVLACGMTLLP